MRLLAFPGINVVTASGYGGELRPITNYANSKSIAGRADLYPSRYQTSTTDCPHGKLLVRRNRSLRAALVRAARCLNCCNEYFMGIAHEYLQRHPGKDGKIPIARSFSRLSEVLPQIRLRLGQQLEPGETEELADALDPRNQLDERDGTHGS